MQKIDTISSIEGRKLLHAIFRELKFERQLSSFNILSTLWKLCTNELETKKYSNFNVVIQHRLGVRRGTALWMEEIVNRFFFSSVLSFVYFGAALLIVIIGINRFTDFVTKEFVIASVIFEATMLILMFIIMLFAPNDDSYYEDSSIEDDSTEELLLEIGEIGRDLAAVIVTLEKLTDSFKVVHQDQKELINAIKEHSQLTNQAISPNPEMIEHLKKTNESLEEFRSGLTNVNENLSQLKNEEIKAAVRAELEGIIQKKLDS